MCRRDANHAPKLDTASWDHPQVHDTKVRP